MAAGTITAFDSFVYHMAQGNIAYLTNTICAALLNNNYTPVTSVHDAWDDVSSHVCTSGDYAVTYLSSRTITQDSSKRTVFDAADVDYGDSVSISARYMVIYKDSGTPSTSYLLWYVDLNDGGSEEVESSSSDFDIAFHSDGIYRIDP